MSEGFPCPKCNTINRPGAKFCPACGLDMTVFERKTVPLEQANLNNAATQQYESGATVMNNPNNEYEPRNHKTKPLEFSSNFDPRPSGAIFGDIYLSEQLIFTDETQHRYVVRQLADGNHRYRVCPNQDCTAVNPPAHDTAIYCTDCGTVLGTEPPNLVLVETSTLLYENIAMIAEKPSLTAAYARQLRLSQRDSLAKSDIVW